MGPDTRIGPQWHAAPDRGKKRPRGWGPVHGVPCRPYLLRFPVRLRKERFVPVLRTVGVTLTRHQERPLVMSQRLYSNRGKGSTLLAPRFTDSLYGFTDLDVRRPTPSPEPDTPEESVTPHPHSLRVHCDRVVLCVLSSTSPWAWLPGVGVRRHRRRRPSKWRHEGRDRVLNRFLTLDPNPPCVSSATDTTVLCCLQGR